MGVDGKGRGVKGVGKDCIGGLATDPRELRQFLSAGGDLPTVLLDNGGGGGNQVLALVAEESKLVDVFLQLLAVRPGQRLRRWILDKQVSGDFIDPFIGALGRKDCGHQELVGVAEIQGAGGLRVELRQPVHDGLVPCLFP